MVRPIDHTKMGRGKHGWLDSHFHFSFAEYRNEDNVNFGVLRVVNDDLVQPGKGFDTHPHGNMEILSYVVDGELTHADSMQNQQTLTRGQVQYMSAGTGVLHSEYNRGDEVLRFLQIWIFPDREGYKPQYGDFRFNWDDRKGRWMPVASGEEGDAYPITIHADVHVAATEIEAGKSLKLPVASGRQAYLILIEGEADVAGNALHARDAAEITEEDVEIQAKENSHLLVIEMAKE